MISIKSLLVRLNQRPISYLPVYADICGDIVSGVMLSQLVYWASVKNGGEFYKTDSELAGEIRAGVKEFKNAKRKIKNLEFVSVKNKGIPAKTHYLIDMEKLAEAICFLSDFGDESPKGTSQLGRKGQTNTENTTENTIIINDTLSNSPDKNLPSLKAKKNLRDKTIRVDEEAPKKDLGVFYYSEPELVAALRRHSCTVPRNDIMEIISKIDIDIQTIKGKFKGIKGIATKIQLYWDNRYDQEKDISRQNRLQCSQAT